MKFMLNPKYRRQEEKEKENKNSKRVINKMIKFIQRKN